MPRCSAMGLFFILNLKTIMQFFIPVHKKNIVAFAVLLAGFGDISAQTLSVALSDNLIVLTDQQRSGMLELVNLGDDPIEFNIKTAESANGTLKDGTNILRWAPARTLVQPHRTAAMRVSSRITDEMPPGEYVFRARVSTVYHQAEKRAVPGLPSSEDESAKNVLSVSIPVTPTLPVTVYMRHGIAPPTIEVKPFVSTPDDPKWMGYFPVQKVHPQYAFVGYVQVIDKVNGAILNGGRLHLPPGDATPVDNTHVRIEWPAKRESASGQYCLRVWDQFPKNGLPAKEKCD